MTGVINKGPAGNTGGYYSPDGFDAAVIRAIFAGPTGAPLASLDDAPGDLGGLLSILGKLGRLRVAGGRLTVS